MTMPASPCGEMIGYPKLEIREDGAYSERLLKVKAADSANWINYFFDNPSCPYFTAWGYSLPPLLAKLEFIPLPGQKITSAGSAGVASYEWGLLHLWYDGNLRVHDLTKTVVKERIETDFETVAYSADNLEWKSGGGIGLPEVVHKHIPGEKYTIHFPYSTTSGTSVAPGSINTDTFTAYVLQRTFPPYTLLYCGCETNITISNSGWTRWNKTFVFKYRPDPWNKFFREGAGANAFEQINVVVAGAVVGALQSYAETSFAGKFV